MADDSAGGVNYFLSIPKEHIENLLSIRHWQELRIAVEGDIVWIKGLTSIHLDTMEIRTMPFAKLFYGNGAKLYPAGSLLPERSMPAVLWSPIQSGLPIELPVSVNTTTISAASLDIRIMASERLQKESAMIVETDILRGYILNAPSVRLQSLSWAIIDQKALIVGRPLLPVPGQTFWSSGNFLIASGYELEFELLSSVIQQEIDPTGNYLILATADGDFKKTAKADLRPLSIFSFRETFKL